MLSINIEAKKNKASDLFHHKFEDFILRSVNIENIENIHLLKNSNKLFTKGTDQSSWLHKIIYKEFDKADNSEVILAYYQLCSFLVKDLFESTKIHDWAIQRFPSVRIQYPENLSVFEFHRDSDYNHPLGEINFFMAITSCFGTAALHIEKNLGWENYEPLTLNPGEFAMINTSILKHGDFINKENFTRISVDFRMIPLQNLRNNEQKASLSKNRRFNENEYFRNYYEINDLIRI